MKPKSWQIILVLSIGVLAVSMAAIFARLSMEAGGKQSIDFSLFLAASRLVIAALILLPTWRKIPQLQVSPSAYYYAIAAGICLALHFATWISSLAFTSIAASTTLVTTNPIWVGLLSRWWLKEKLSQQSILGIAIALTGGILIALGDADSSSSYSNPILGDILALVGAWMASLYIILGSQAQQQGLNLSNYIAIAYSSAAIILLPLPLLFQGSYLGYPLIVYLYVLLMAIVSQLFGHTSFNWALRWISPNLISLTLLLEPITSSWLGFIIFNEIPSRLVFIGGLILLTGVGISLLGKKEKRRSLDN
ncbi:MAG: DMT family transporter [Pleurocapsa sp.]